MDQNSGGPNPPGGDKPTLDVFELTVGAVRHLWALRGPHSILAFIVVAPYALMGILGLLDPFYSTAVDDGLPDGYMTSALLIMAWGLLWNTPVMVLWYRLFLVGPDQMLKLSADAMVKRVLRLIGYSLLFALMVGGVALLAGLALSVFTGGGALNQAFLMAVILVAALVLGGRLCLTFASIPLGHLMPFRMSWERTKGHGLAISGAFLLCALVAALAGAVLSGVIGTGLFGAPAEGAETMVVSRWMFAVDLLLSPISYAGSALVCSVTAAAFHRLVGPPTEAVDIRA